VEFFPKYWEIFVTYSFFVKTFAPKEKRPPMDTVMVPLEGLLRAFLITCPLFLPAEQVNRADLG